MNQNPFPIRLAQSEATIVHQNGHYEYDAGKETILEEGDMLIAQSEYIDTQQLSSGTFVFEEDTILSITGILYEINNDLTGKTVVKGSIPQADYKIYQVQVTTDPGVNDVKYHTFTQQITVPAGAYEPVALGQLVTDKFSYVAPMEDVGLITSGSNLLINSLAGLSGTITDINVDAPIVVGEDSFGGVGYYKTSEEGMFWSNDQNKPFLLDPLELPIYGISPKATSGVGTGLLVDFLIFGEGYIGGGTTWPEHPYFNIVSPGTGYVLGDTITFNSEQFHYFWGGVYDAWELCKVGGTMTFTITGVNDDTSYYEMTLIGEPPLTSDTSYKYTDEYWIGASEVDLEFNTTFSWKFLHTPEYDTDTSPPQPAVSIIKDNTNNWRTIDRVSGIAVTKLSPPDIWARMGFDLTKVLCQAVNPATGALVNITNSTPNTYPIDLDSFNASTTRSYLGLNALLNAGSRAVPTANITQATTLTVPITASNYKVDTGAGHFIIRINAGYDQNMITNAGILQAAAIVSKQFNSNDIVTGGIDSGIPYIHSGEPISLSRFEVEILDGLTMELATSLGENNTVYMQIQKAQPQTLAKPTDQKKEKDMDTL